MIQYLTVIFLLLTANNCFSAGADTARNGAETTSQLSLPASTNTEKKLTDYYYEDDGDEFFLGQSDLELKKYFKKNSSFGLITNADSVQISNHEEESVVIKETLIMDEILIMKKALVTEKTLIYNEELEDSRKELVEGVFFEDEISLSAITDRKPNKILQYHILVPTSTNVTVTTVNRSDVFITGVASVKLLHEAGTIRVKNVPGKVKIRKLKTGFIFIDNCPNSEDVTGRLSTIERG